MPLVHKTIISTVSYIYHAFARWFAGPTSENQYADFILVFYIFTPVCFQIAHLRFTFVIHHELVNAVRQKYSATAAVSTG